MTLVTGGQLHFKILTLGLSKQQWYIVPRKPVKPVSGWISDRRGDAARGPDRGDAGGGGGQFHLGGARQESQVRDHAHLGRHEGEAGQGRGGSTE